MIPQEPNMLLSYVNLKLRDYYPSFEAMCDDLDINITETEQTLNRIDYYYDRQINQFICKAEE